LDAGLTDGFTGHQLSIVKTPTGPQPVRPGFREAATTGEFMAGNPVCTSSSTISAGASSFGLDWLYRKVSSVLWNKVCQAPALWHAHSQSTAQTPTAIANCSAVKLARRLVYHARAASPGRTTGILQRGVTTKSPGNSGGEMDWVSGSFSDKKQDICSNTRQELGKKEKGEKKCR
jgi:hypothetical protein